MNVFAKGQKFRAWILELVLKPNRQANERPPTPRLRRGLGLLIAAALASGLAGSLWAARLVEALLFHLEPRDPVTFGGAAAVLVAVGVLAAWLAVHRAARLDPVTALREG